MTMKNGIPFYYVRNKENGLFSMYYVLDMGKFNNIKLPTAVQLLQYLGTDKYSAEQISKEFYKLACDFGVSAGDEQVYVYLDGLDENFEAAVKLFEHLLANAKPDQDALNQLVQRTLKGRKDAKLNKQTIFWQALRSYAIYGKNNPYTYILSEDQLMALKAEELTNLIHSLTSYQHKIYYYGPKDAAALVKYMDGAHKTPKKLLAYPAPVKFTRQETNTNVVYFTNYKMVQAEVAWLNKQTDAFSVANIPVITLFNEYFGGGMSSVVFQTIRESKALAYSTYSRYTSPAKKDDPYYILAYVGTQADKINDAVPAMSELLNNMPKTETSFSAAKDALKNQIETERINKEQIFFSMMSAEKLGVDHDTRKDVYDALGTLSYDKIQAFHDSHYKGKTYTYCIMGSKEKLNPEDLKKYGEVREVSLEEIFGY